MTAEFIFVVRHGDTKANEKGIEAGPLDYPLSKRGRKEVEFIAKTLAIANVQAVYSSPVFRAVQTAKILARPHKLKVKTLDELTEAKFKPEFVGKKGRHHILTNPEAYTETNRELLARVWKAFETASKESKGNAIMVSHGDVITALLEEIVERKITSEKYYVLHPEPASLNIIKLGDKPSLVLYNYHRKMFAGY